MHTKSQRHSSVFPAIPRTVGGTLAMAIVLLMAALPILAQTAAQPIGRNAPPGPGLRAIPPVPVQQPPVFARPTKPPMRYQTPNDTWIVYPQPTSDYTGSTTNYGGGDGSGNFITSLGPFTFSVPMSENNVPNSWATWNCPPATESCTPNVLYAYGATQLTITVIGQANIVGFELEPDQFQMETVTATFHSSTGDAFILTLSPNGSYGALLDAVQDTTPGTLITSVDINDTSGDDFAIAQLRAGAPPPPPPPCDGGDDTLWYSFTGGQDGSAPLSVTLDPAGNLFGTTWGYRGGFIFNFSRGGISNLYSFAGAADGRTSSPLLIDPGGTLYGVSDGGLPNCGGSYCGEVFSLKLNVCATALASCPWKKTSIYQFSGLQDSYQVSQNQTKLVADAEGNLYGVSTYGGGVDCGGGQGCGTVFQVTKSGAAWTEHILHTFTGGIDGHGPTAILMGTDGSLYGAAQGGLYNSGQIFRLTKSGTDWTKTALYDLDGQHHACGTGELIQDSSGNLYGIAGDCTYYGNQTIFMLSPAQDGWVFTWLYTTDYWSQGWIDGIVLGGWGLSGILAGPACLGETCGYDQNVYGQLFALYPGGGDGWQYVPLHTFYWWSPHYVTADSGGQLWGTSPTGGAYCEGAIWRY